MSRAGKWIVVAGMAAVSAGCSVKGKWSLAEVDPEAARRDFEYASLTLQDDGSFYAESQKPGIHTTSGTYVYKNNVLTLTPHEGPQMSYDASMPDNDHLKLKKLWEGQKLVTTFKRVE